jgi:hypothetical protein
VKVRIEIEASTTFELAGRLTKLAAHVLRSDAPKPIKILDADGAVVADLTIQVAKP